MMESLKLVIVLTVICSVAGALLAVVHDVTAEPIAAAAQMTKGTAIMEVLPECDNNPAEESTQIEHNGRTWTFFVARKAGQFVGAAFESTTSAGYGGDITIMAGVTAESTVQGIQVLAHKETPGLGAWIEDEVQFRSKFAGRSIADTKWAVTKDGGDIDQITAATISSRAVTEAVKAGLDVFTANTAAIAGN